MASCLQLLIWFFKPLNGLLSFIEFIAFITHSPDLVDFEPDTAFYWILTVLLGIYGFAIMLTAIWVASAENYLDRFFPWAWGYFPIRLVAFVAILLKLRSSGDSLFLMWFDLAAMIVGFATFGVVAYRGYFHQQKPEKKPIVDEMI